MKRVMNIMNFAKTHIDSQTAARSILNQDILQMQIYMAARYRSLKLSSEQYIIDCLGLQGFKWEICEERENTKEIQINKKIDISGIIGYFKKGHRFEKMNCEFINKYCQPVEVKISVDEVKSYDVEGVKNCFNIYKEVGWSLKINKFEHMADDFGKMSLEDQRKFMKLVERRLFFREFTKHERVGQNEECKIIYSDKSLWEYGTEKNWDMLRSIEGVK